MNDHPSWKAGCAGQWRPLWALSARSYPGTTRGMEGASSLRPSHSEPWRWALPRDPRCPPVEHLPPRANGKADELTSALLLSTVGEKGSQGAEGLFRGRSGHSKGLLTTLGDTVSHCFSFQIWPCLPAGSGREVEAVQHIPGTQALIRDGSLLDHSEMREMPWASLPPSPFAGLRRALPAAPRESWLPGHHLCPLS